MIENKPSHTAYRVAVRRAAHQLFENPRVLDDPIALRIIGPKTRAHLQARVEQGRRRVFGRHLRAFLVARSRIAEDALAEAVKHGVRQYVVLGAGLDTFAYRNPWPDVRVFEVDFPATQGWKRERLAQGGIIIPPSVVYAPVDFTRQSLADGLAAAGLDTTKPTFFSWLGVTMYLEKPAVESTLRYIAANAHKGGGVVFDYATDPKKLNLVGRLIMMWVAYRVKKAGEPFISNFDPPELVVQLKGMGFSDVEDIGPDEINRRYYDGRDDGFRIAGHGHVMKALV